jgi:hypothetical protein
LTAAALSGRVPLPHGLSFRVPQGASEAVLTALATLPDTEKSKASRAVQAVHVANGKQSIAVIAKKYLIDVGDLAERTGLATSAVPAKGERLSIPPATARYTLLPEARTLPLSGPPSMSPVLVANAAVGAAPDGTDGADVSAVDADTRSAIDERIAQRAAAHAAQTAHARPTGVVLARITGVEPLAPDVVGVDVVAGRPVEAITDIDVVAGVAPQRAASTTQLPLVSSWGSAPRGTIPHQARIASTSLSADALR